MAYIQADVDVMNMALRRVGSEAIILSDANSPTSKSAKVVTSYYDNTVKEVVRMMPWNLCIARASVTGASDTTTDYDNVFSLSGLFPYPYWKASTSYALGNMILNTAGNRYVCVHAGTSTTSEVTTTTDETVITDGTAKWVCLGAYSSTLIRTLDINGDSTIPYRIEGTNLYCNETSPIKLRYLKLPTAPFGDPMFVEAVISRLASKLCYAMSGDAQLAQVLFQEYTITLGLAKQLCISEDRGDVIDILALYQQSAALAVRMNKTEG